MKQVSRKDAEGILISQGAAFHRVLVHGGTREQTPFFAPVTSKHVPDKICSEGHGSLVQLKENQHLEALQEDDPKICEGTFKKRAEQPQSKQMKNARSKDMAFLETLAHNWHTSYHHIVTAHTEQATRKAKWGSSNNPLSVSYSTSLDNILLLCILLPSQWLHIQVKTKLRGLGHSPRPSETPARVGERFFLPASRGTMPTESPTTPQSSAPTHASLL